MYKIRSFSLGLGSVLAWMSHTANAIILQQLLDVGFSLALHFPVTASLKIPEPTRWLIYFIFVFTRKPNILLSAHILSHSGHGSLRSFERRRLHLLLYLSSKRWKKSLVQFWTKDFLINFFIFSSELKKVSWMRGETSVQIFCYHNKLANVTLTLFANVKSVAVVVNCYYYPGNLPR